MSRINRAHRYLIRRNRDGRYVGSTDDRGARIPEAHQLVDTIGEDGLGPGVAWVLRNNPLLRESLP